MSPKRKNHTGLKLILIALMVVFLAGSAFLVKASLDLASEDVQKITATMTVPGRAEENPTTEPTAEATTQATEPPPGTVVATASLSAQGDILMHLPLFDDTSYVKQPDGSYDFSSHFTYLTPYIEKYDWAVANLETTFGGDNHPYQGWPLFNCRDSLAPAMKAAGYDMLLTANNHSYDTLMEGLLRTQQVVTDAGLEKLGSRLSTDEKRYAIQDINGIRIGLICYTYTTSMGEGGKPRLNGNSPVEQPELINYFAMNQLNVFYDQVDGILADMEAEGVDATLFYIHWGYEYKVLEDASQNQIAQALCDRGIDVIIGGHPHVVQPMELLTSARDPEHKTVCIYSLGNAVSNQRREKMNLNTGETEDGLFFGVTFEKCADGQVYLTAVEALPTWVNMHTKNGRREYNILPLDEATRDAWQGNYDLTDKEREDCDRSWTRTMNIIGEGLNQVNTWLEQSKQDRESYYRNLTQ